MCRSPRPVSSLAVEFFTYSTIPSKGSFNWLSTGVSGCFIGQHIPTQAQNIFAPCFRLSSRSHADKGVPFVQGVWGACLRSLTGPVIKLRRDMLHALCSSKLVTLGGAFLHFHFFRAFFKETQDYLTNTISGRKHALYIFVCIDSHMASEPLLTIQNIFKTDQTGESVNGIPGARETLSFSELLNYL